MKSVYPRCAGLDAHKKFVVAYSLSTSAAAAPVQVYLRERAAGLLKVAAGASVATVAATGLLQPRQPETLSGWIARYRAAGLAGLTMRAGRGRKPVCSPRPPAVAHATLGEVVARSPRLFALPASRWTLRRVRSVVPWLGAASLVTVHRLLRRAHLVYKRGRRAVHSPVSASGGKIPKSSV